MLKRHGRNFLLTLCLVVFMTPQLQAASQDECAIWICLPGGFPAGCGAAHAAMVSRLKDFKPPLPDFLSCAVKSDGGGEMSYDYNYAAYVPPRRACTQWVDEGESSYCAQYADFPERYIKGTKCRTQKEDENTPAGCTGTARYIDVMIDGKLAGNTYYWGQTGPRRW